MKKNMKRVIALLLLLGMVVPVFAMGTKFAWYPLETESVEGRMRIEYNSFSNSQRALADDYVNKVFAPVKAKLSKGSSATRKEKIEALLQLTDDYEKLKQQDPKVGRYFGAYLAQLAFATEDEDPCPFANVVMDLSNKTEYLTERSRLGVDLSLKIRDDYDSFREMEIAEY